MFKAYFRLSCLLLVLLPSTGSAVPKHYEYSTLFGVWSEDCRSRERIIIITPNYHVILNQIAGGSGTIGFGKIVKFEPDADEITVRLIDQFLHEFGEPDPKYKIINKHTIFVVRNRDYWAETERIYNEKPGSRPSNYIYISDKEYGIPYHLCTRKSTLMKD